MFVHAVNSHNGFKANLRQTSQGNFYTETTTGKTAGTVLGLSTAVLLGCSSIVQDGAKGLATKFFKQNPNPNNVGWLAAGIILAAATLITSVGRRLGSIMDNVVNNDRYDKADRIY